MTALLSAAAMPGAASAQAKLVVTATGEIPSRCTLGLDSPFPTSDFSKPGSAAAKAAVDCNQGFTITAKSANGAIKTANALPSGDAYTNTLPYTLKLDVPLDGGATVSTPVCNSGGMGGTACSVSSGGTSAMSKTAALTVNWTTPAGPRLIAGSYSDTITLSIAPSP